MAQRSCDPHPSTVILSEVVVRKAYDNQSKELLSVWISNVASGNSHRAGGTLGMPFDVQLGAD